MTTASTDIVDTSDDQDDTIAPHRSLWSRHENTLLGILGVIAFLIFWEASAVFQWANPLFTSSPTRIVAAAVSMVRDGSIWGDLWVSGVEFALGYGLAVIIGVPLGILTGWYRRLNALLEPFINALYATPRIALMPLLAFSASAALIVAATLSVSAGTPVLAPAPTGLAAGFGCNGLSNGPNGQ